MKLIENYSLAHHNTFGIDVHARYFIQVYDDEALREALQFCSDNNLDLLILGGGSNILFTKNFDGLVIEVCYEGTEIIKENGNEVFIRASAGQNWHQFVLDCVDRGLGGIENLSLIPGKVGAAPIQNIGAYGVELVDVFESLQAIDLKGGETVEFTRDECGFGYRDSIFKSEAKGMFLIKNIVLRLSRDPVLNTSYDQVRKTLEDSGISSPDIKSVSDAIIKIRTSKLPDPEKIGNAGSFFKNPVIDKIDYEGLKAEFPGIKGYSISKDLVKIPAGWLIEECGWKGTTTNNVGVYKNQALVLVNYGGGSGSEIKELADKIKESVADKFGIELVHEVNIL